MSSTTASTSSLSLPLVVGKRYVTRDGRVTGPLKGTDADNTYPFSAIMDGFRYTWTRYGTYSALGKEPNLDLVAEVDSPLFKKGQVVVFQPVEPDCHGAKPGALAVVRKDFYPSKDGYLTVDWKDASGTGLRGHQQNGNYRHQHFQPYVEPTPAPAPERHTITITGTRDEVVSMILNMPAADARIAIGALLDRIAAKAA